jgi:hypothetical protein
VQRYTNFIASTTATNSTLTVLSNASCVVYIAGTLGAATLYSDNGVTPLANPFLSSATGRIDFYAANGRYDVVVSKAGYLTVTISDIELDDLLASSGSNSVGYLPAGAGAVASTVQTKLRESVSVKDFGAVGDGVKDAATGVITGTNNFTAFQAALTYLQAAGGGSLYIPNGKYAFYNTGVALTTQLMIKSNIVMYGDGKESSQMLFADSTGIFSPLLNVASPYSFDIKLEKIGFVSDWGALSDWTQRSHYMALTTSGRVEITDCLFSSIRYFCCSIGYTQAVQEVKVTNCTFYRSVGDGCSIRNANSAIVTGNYFQDINDDCIAVHSMDTETEPVQNSAIISNNHIVDSQGIRVQGIKKAVISGNVITRAQYAAIDVSTYSSEGNTPDFALTISGNTIDTVFDGSLFAPAVSGAGVRYISLSMPIPTTDGTGYVGYGNGSGGVVQPFDYFYKNDTDASPAKPEFGAWFINISGNVITRSYSTTAAYTDYGLGQRYARLGPVSTAITTANLGLALASTLRGQIAITNSARFAVISNNTLFGGNMGISLSGTNGSAYQSWDDVRISDNQIAQYFRDGVNVTGEGNVVVSGNMFNGDPLNSHLYRAANGKWTFPGGGDTFNTAVRVDGGFSEITSNSFRNVQVPLALIALADVGVGENTYYCNPVAAAQDVNNIGIGNLNSVYARGADNVVIMDDDPASGTFGKSLSLCSKTATSIPTTGTYLIGHFSTNVNKAVLGAASSQYMVLGWSRLTTGSAHVLNTDWSEARVLTGT